jgi:type VI secretion system secreted protein VgrG
MTATPERDTRFSLDLASGDALEVRAVTVREQISTLFSVSLTAVAANPDLDFEAVIARPARLAIQAGLAGGVRTRVWTGLCRSVKEIAVEESGLSTYEMEIVPTLWLLGQRRNHRMFQRLSDVDIALALLGEWGIEPVQQLAGSYKKRKYRVQYGESDLAFLSRLLSDAGVSFTFDDSSGETRLVLSDAPERSPLRAPRIPFYDRPGDTDAEHVTKVRAERQVRPGRYTLRDHDYRRPPSYKLLASAAAEAGVEQQLERFHYVPGAFLFESDRGDPTPAADDRGRFRTDESEAAAMAQRRLDADRSEAFTCTFETNAVDLSPGVVFSMLRHPRRDLGDDRRLLVVKSSLHAEVGRALHVETEARSAAVTYRPPLVTPKPTTHGVESATVVGPPGEEIHTDEFGRVRVHFHWDRESRMDEKSSCWIHVSQPWGGTGYGGMNLPRIGQEVLVDFLGGDPDRPVIVGRLYTNLQKVPYPLPANKTQSGWRSNSTNQTGGYNEMMFEDASGQELVRMQAEKDMHKLVKNDEEHTVGRDRTRQVNRDEAVTIGSHRTKQVGKTERVSVGQHQNITVGVNRVAQIGNNDTTIVGHQHVVMIAPPGEAFNTSDASTVMTSKKIVLGTGGGATITMEGDSIAVSCKNVTFAVGEDFILDATNVFLHGTAKADLASDGNVTVRGGEVEMSGSPVEISSDGDMDLTSQGTLGIRGAVVDVKGLPIKLNS